MILPQFVDAARSTYPYLPGVPKIKETVMVDPVGGMG